ncbi:dienelactone hydrolase family protein [Micromonospora sp. PLK6-60]|uniref:alpha/beta hydrolase family protein n=1 Tax=Micromonospora sp. PLK6-60 TaxID=2873383 RepID=UPI001CA6E77B|nr:dienelactone hydrolase family protein [Micromonospora sp. PLK6-60]MBY8873479.1 dienelactone hydrolase family protein [Micromonospora sp. PLK6-60]
MCPRRIPVLLTAALLSVGLAGCSGQPTPAGRDAPPPATGKPTTPAPRVPEGHAPDRAFAVGVRELKLNRDGDRPLPVTLWYPARGEAGGDPERSVPAAAGRFPVVMFSHGLGGRPADYATLLTRWAAAGFVVAAPAFPHTRRGADGNVLDVLNQPADVSYALTRVLALDGAAGDPLRGRLATDRVAATGHSAGGVTTIGLFTASRDDRLDAGVVFAGTGLGVGTAFAGAAAPQLFVHGEADEVVDYAAGKAVYDAVPWPKAMLSLTKGDHGRALLTDGAALRVVADTTVEFLRWTLYGDRAAKDRLPAEARRGNLATLDDNL